MSTFIEVGIRGDISAVVEDAACRGLDYEMEQELEESLKHFVREIEAQLKKLSTPDQLRRDNEQMERENLAKQRSIEETTLLECIDDEEDPVEEKTIRDWIDDEEDPHLRALLRRQYF